MGVSNSNAMMSYNGPVVVEGGARCVTSISADDTLNNDYFYDDEFAVPFDAHIAVVPPLCRSLTDSCLDDDDGRRHGGRLTLSRSESCLCQSPEDSQADEMMSTSERAGDFLVSSSEMSDVDADQRPLFSPMPTDSEEVPGVEGIRGNEDGSGSQMGESAASGEGGARLRCAMYDATSARRQYRLSFGGPSTPTKISSSAEDCARWKTVDRAGLTTWRQVSRVQPMEPGFTTWQRLRSSTSTDGGPATARSVSLVEWSKHGHHPTPPTCGADRIGRSGQLLRLYQSSRTSPTTHARTQTASDDGRIYQHAAKVSDVAGSRARERSVRGQRSGRRTVAGRTSADKCVQCLPSFRDRCVQTSTLALLRTDKSLQTSVMSDQMLHSALLLSRPLPDLDFLRLCTSSSAVPRRAEVVDVVAGRRNSDGAPGGGTPSLGDSGHGVSPAGSGRSSAAARRHHGSDSGLSNNSSSSSGIEQGDSAATQHDRAPASPATSVSAGPRKPPRSFTVEPRPSAVSRRRHTDGDLPFYSDSPVASPPCVDSRRLTCCCEEASPIPNDDDDYSTVTSDNFVVHGGMLRRWQTTNCSVLDEAEQTDDSDTNQAVYSRDFVASHPLCRRSPPRSAASGRRKVVEGLVSPTRHREAEVGSRTSLRTARRRHVGSTCHVHGHPPHHHHHHHHVQTSPAKPAKSILVRRRQRGKARHRSLSDAHDVECCEVVDDDDDAAPSPQPASRVARPVSLPDATVLYAGLTDFAGDELDLGERPQCPADDVDDGCTDGEHFRAKKSVSFSEKIFYHSMPSVSPLESPLCPLKLAAAPECRFKVAALQPASETVAHGMLVYY